MGILRVPMSSRPPDSQGKNVGKTIEGSVLIVNKKSNTIISGHYRLLGIPNNPDTDSMVPAVARYAVSLMRKASLRLYGTVMDRDSRTHAIPNDGRTEI